MSDLHQRLEFATQLAHQAGEIMLQHFQIGLAQEAKADSSPVTIADHAVNRLVIESVIEHYPNDGVLGEEESYVKENAEYLWVCDPIDGTRAYALGIPTNMFSLALVKDGESLLGVIYDPYLKRLYSGVKGDGAALNLEKISVSQDKNLEKQFIGVPGITVPLFDTSSLFAQVLKQKTYAFSVLSITYSSMLVASGQIPGTYFANISAHDIAAVKVIVEEAGGKVTDLFGNEQRYDQQLKGAIISNGVVHDQLLELVKPYLTV